MLCSLSKIYIDLVSRRCFITLLIDKNLLLEKKQIDITGYWVAKVTKLGPDNKKTIWTTLF